MLATQQEDMDTTALFCLEQQLQRYKTTYERRTRLLLILRFQSYPVSEALP